jgi:hypothetical protein
LSGMALGWDLAVAKACTILGVPFLAAVPFAGQENIWPRESKELYHELLAQASEVVIVSSGGYARWKFIARDHYMGGPRGRNTGLMGWPETGRHVPVRAVRGKDSASDPPFVGRMVGGNQWQQLRSATSRTPTV